MTRPLTILMSAGEPSGDALGAGLIAELRARHPGVRIIGVGGPAMRAQGLVSFFDIAELAVMGIRDVAPKLRILFRRMGQLAAFALRMRPDVVVLIDSGDFHHRVAKRIRARDPTIKIVKYVSPQIWASRPGRAEGMKAYLDHVLCLLPFEPPFYERYGLPATFVGHPALERARLMTGGDALRARLGIAGDAPLLCVLPGSRRSEVRPLLPDFRATVAQLAPSLPGLNCVLPTVPTVDAMVRQGAIDWPTPLHILTGDADRYAAFDASDVALAASGTVTTELAVASTPMIVAYKVGRITHQIWKRLITARFATIVNLVLDRAAVPEFLQYDVKPAAMATALRDIFTDPSRQKADLAAAISQLGTPDGPSRTAARIVLEIADQATRSR